MNENIFRQNPRLAALSERLLHARQRGELLLQSGDEGWSSAPSNIALLKYWGKKNGLHQLPMNSSVSLTLNAFRAYTRLTVRGRFVPLKDGQSPSFAERPHFSLMLNASEAAMPAKMEGFLKSILHGFADEIAVRVESVNNFPTACGVASSAAGYAALAAAVADLLNLKRFLSEADLQFWLTEWARIGSGSATRSAVFAQAPESSQYVVWELAERGDSSATMSLATHPNFAQMQHCVLVLDSSEKSVGSSEGHVLAQTSVLQDIRLAHYPRRLQEFRTALAEGDFRTVQRLSELDAFEMHAVMLSGATKLEYMSRKTSQAIAHFVTYRDAHAANMLWTLDAGANPHFLFLPDAAQHMQSYLTQLAQQGSFSGAQLLWGNTQGQSIEIGETHGLRAALRQEPYHSSLKQLPLAEAAVFFAEGDLDASL